MREIETDYLVVGAGASGMAFVDSLLACSDAEVVIVDRRHRPGGHWIDAYPFVRLHQPSATYGVSSKPLGLDRIDETGPNAGFYERATAAEICDYFSRVLDDFVASGRVRFMGMTDYWGADAKGHHLTSLLTGEATSVGVRRRLVDATYVESSIPSRHQPPFTVDADVRLIPPNDLVDLAEPAAGFTVFGAGKTAMDTCNWLLDTGVDPEKIQWFRPRDPWLFNRAYMQPLELVAGYIHLQACWVQACAEAEDGHDFARRLEAEEIFTRIDKSVQPTVFRGATISNRELESLRAIERVVRGARVLHVGSTVIKTDEGDLPTEANRVYVDCTAAGVRPTVSRPIFGTDHITLQYVTIGIVPWGAATVGAAEALYDDDAEKNRLCPPLQFTGNAADLPRIAHAGMSGLVARSVAPVLNAWNDSSRLNPARGAGEHFDDPRVSAGFVSIGANMGKAMENLARLAGPPA